MKVRRGVWAALAAAGFVMALNPAARAGQIDMLLFQHESTGNYGTMMLLSPDEPLLGVTGSIDDDRAVSFLPTDDGTYLGAWWDMPTMTDVFNLVGGQWQLHFDHGDPEPVTVSFRFDTSAVDAESLLLPTAPTITNITHREGESSLEWTNHEPDALAMLAGAVDWDGDAVLVLDAAADDGVTSLGALTGLEHEYLLGALTLGPAGLLTDASTAGEWQQPTLWTSTLTSHVAAIPEPATAALLTLAGPLLLRRRKRRRGRGAEAECVEHTDGARG